MNAIEHLTQCLKSARQEKNLSQRAISLKTGIQQNQISRIESGQADLRVSTLVELARSLDLEVMLIPRSLFPAVNSITQKKTGSDNSAIGSRPAYQLDIGDDDE
ncbi:MAG: helix-turn-helix transcriptional regulator [Deltaproteobacteria bacterium]|nr:helix-turn-helix transcriptional regulator [Deltaproteobacteria bacterium]